MIRAIASILILLTGITASLSSQAAARSNSITLSPDASILAVVNGDSRSITLVDVLRREVVSEIIVGRDPQMASFDPAGSRLYVTNRFDDTVSMIDPDTGKVVALVPVPDEPIGVLATANAVYISCRGAAVVVVLDPSTLSISELIPTDPDPHGLALSGDGSQLYLTHFSTGRMSVIDTENHVVEAVVETGLDTNLSHSITLSPDGSLAYLPQTRSGVSNPALVFDSTVFPVVSVVDLGTLTHIQSRRIHLDISDTPVNMPFDAAFVGNSKLYVLNAGSNDISVIDLETMKALAHLKVGHNPRGLVLSADQGTLFVNNHLAGTVSVIDTATDTVSTEIKVTDIALTGTLLNGKRMFNRSDRSDLARDQWISCATCHFEGEMDNRTWFFPDGPRNTTSLLGVRDTLPLHWSGDLDELQDVETTVRNIQAGTGLAPGDENCRPACDQAPPNAGRSKDLDDIAAFMASLEFPPNPNLNSEGGLSASASRGKDLFDAQETGCAGCHIPPLYIDRLTHDIGTAAETGERKGAVFDTPTLRGIYKTAPYLHDGSAMTLLDVVTSQNPDDLHGMTSQLEEMEMQDLVAFLESIGGEDSGFLINAGLNDAWFEASKSGQGFFITVLPDAGQIFLAWFTYETERPDDSAVAQLGEPGHRWQTAQGAFSGNKAMLDLFNTSGGILDGEAPKPTTEKIGTILLEFSGCNAGTVSYDIPAINRQGVIPIERIVPDNVSLCEALSQEGKAAQ